MVFWQVVLPVSELSLPCAVMQVAEMVYSSVRVTDTEPATVIENVAVTSSKYVVTTRTYLRKAWRKEANSKPRTESLAPSSKSKFCRGIVELNVPLYR